ncbi:fimbrial protein, partial [Atlantibacter subterranea]|uniref:fimbrial protein n=1 Tax=Atlantibacter subterraneus TaxID=255519 RepID=UPI002FDE0A66
DGNPRQWRAIRVDAGSATVYLIKTDEILNGGALTTGLVGEVRDDFNHNVVQVVLSNATISIPACNLNNGNPIDVDFGSAVAVTDVAAGTVEKSIDYTLTCTYDNFGLKMKILGTGASFDNDLLQTDINEMGIKITANGTALPLNTDLNFASAAAKPALKAILTQQPGARLPTGAFTASATMRVEYQ